MYQAQLNRNMLVSPDQHLPGTEADIHVHQVLDLNRFFFPLIVAYTFFGQQLFSYVILPLNSQLRRALTHVHTESRGCSQSTNGPH